MITIFNRTASGLTGISVESAIGKEYVEVLGEDYLEASAVHTLREGPEIIGLEKALQGAGTRVEVGTTWVVDSLGERIGVVEIFDEVSSLRRMEERFEQQKTLTALGEMAAAVAHELRNPLAGIGGFTALLKEDLADQPQHVKIVEKILQGVRDLDKVAGNLLFLTRPTEMKRDKIDLHELITSIVDLLRSEITSTGINVEIFPELPVETVPVIADRDLLRMALTNLGRNAIQAMNPEGHIIFRLTWHLLGNRVFIEVADNGKGIPPENIPRLFTPFFTTRAKGTGLGLALVKKAVDLHKGEIKVDSTDGKGTKFTIVLPIRPYSSITSTLPGSDSFQDSD